MSAIWPVLIGLGCWQVGVNFEQLRQRKVQYNEARRYAEERGKPLLVVGGPWGASIGYAPWRIFNMQLHGYGDVCLDLSEQACQGAPVKVIADIKDIPYPDSYFGAAYTSHILEHMRSISECEDALDELLRVADAVFVAGPIKQDVKAWLTPAHHLWVQQHGNHVFYQGKYNPSRRARYRFST